MEKGRVLSKDEIINLSNSGMKLDQNKYYALYGLFNDKLNQANDPAPFRIIGASMKEIADSLIGRPLVWHPDTVEHLRAYTGKSTEEEAKAIIELQKGYSIGEMVGNFINPTSNNAYGVFEIWPEFIDAVEQHKVPDYVSPLLLERLRKGNDVIKADGIHLQFVKDPGYPRTLAKLHGTCIGGIEQCMKELRIVGASGKILEYRKSFSNSKTGTSTLMDATPIEERMSTLEKGFTEMQTTMKDIHTSVTKIIGAAGPQTGVVVTDIQTKVPPGQESKPDPIVSKLEAELKDLKNKLEQKDKDAADQLIKFQEAQKQKTIENIVKLEQKLHDISNKEATDRPKFYSEADLKTLEIVEKNLSARSEKIIGAAGSGDRELIIMESGNTTKRSAIATHMEVNAL